MTPIEKYAEVILHKGCAIPPINETESRLHKWNECRSKNFYLRIARKHQHALKSNGMAIGTWVKRIECPCNGACHNGHTRKCGDECYDVTILHAPVSE